MSLKMKRIYHPWHEWECYRAGFYNTECEFSSDEARCLYRDFLADIPRFEKALRRVLNEWPNSCRHFLTNDGMNRIAWLGQASMCIETGIPSKFRGGFFLLTEDQQLAANEAAQKWLDIYAQKNQ